MINVLVPLLVPLALTTSPDPAAPPSYHQVRAYVTGYNTVPAQTDDTPCIAASGADICGRHDAIACPRRIGLGTVVEVRGTTYVCEDRLARKFASRFDISCDKDTACPPEVTGWATINVYGEVAPAPADRTPARHAALAHWWARAGRAVAALWHRGRAVRPAVLRGGTASHRPAVFLRHAANMRSRAGRTWRS